MLKGTQIQLFSKFVFFSIIAISLMVFSVCEKRHAELMTPFGNAFLGAPQNLNATTGDNLVTLNWTVTSDSGVAVYFIYRRDSMQQQPSFLDSSATKEYTDENVVNGNLYFYQVSAVDSAGYEGERSAEIRVRPSVYDIIIEDGKKYTNNQTVTLKLTADLNTYYMMIANDSTFTDAAWEVFAPVKSWTLTPNDGEKHVYGKFRDSEGNINRYPAHSTIELDTRASIDSISENTAGVVMAPGQVIHFKLDAGEPNGKATIDIGNQKFNIRLYDDGDNGDAVALDGIYELDYTIPSGMEMMNGIVTGHFTDRAGNVADDVTAAGRVSIQLDPGAVTLFLSVQSGSGTPAIELYWSESDDPDFASYRLFRSATAGVDTSSKLVTTIFDRTTTDYTDSDIKPDEIYHYRVYVYDTQGLTAGSNEVQGQTSANQPPTPVYLYPPAPVGNSLTSLNISWSKNEDTDFVAYRIYRSLTAGVDSTSTLISIIDDQNSTSYEDTGLQGNTTYYYRVYVYDSSGLTRGSNEVNGTTNMNQPPEAITLFSVSPVANSLTRLNLNWSKNEDNDFAAYRIYRALNPGVDSTSVLVTTITDQNITSYEDEGLEQDTEYYYRIFVYDSRGLYSKSNEKKGRTNSNTRPTAVVLYPVVALQDDLNSLRLNWSENGDSDFSKYKIYRSNSATVDSTSFLVQTITDQHATEYEDTGLDEATTYYYRIYVYDDGGLAAGSNIESGTTHANEAPTPVVLATPSIVDSVSLHLSWSRNADDDFAMYTLFRSKTSISDTVSIAPTAIINDQEITEFTDSNLEQNTTYYYRIFVNDSGGLRSGSNEVHAKTMP